jgi:hypothetical protein
VFVLAITALGFLRSFAPWCAVLLLILPFVMTVAVFMAILRNGVADFLGWVTNLPGIPVDVVAQAFIGISNAVRKGIPRSAFAPEQATALVYNLSWAALTAGEFVLSYGALTGLQGSDRALPLSLEWTTAIGYVLVGAYWIACMLDTTERRVSDTPWALLDCAWQARIHKASRWMLVLTAIMGVCFGTIRGAALLGAELPLLTGLFWLALFADVGAAAASAWWPGLPAFKSLWGSLLLVLAWITGAIGWFWKLILAFLRTVYTTVMKFFDLPALGLGHPTGSWIGRKLGWGSLPPPKPLLTVGLAALQGVDEEELHTPLVTQPTA